MLGRQGQFPNYDRRKWCSPEGSNLDVALFRRAREPSLLELRIGCGGWSCTTATEFMRLCGNCSSPQNLVGVHGIEPCRCRPSARSRALIRRTRSPEPTPENGAERENRTLVSALATPRTSHCASPAIWWTVWKSNPPRRSCKDHLRPSARPKFTKQSRTADPLARLSSRASTDMLCMGCSRSP